MITFTLTFIDHTGSISSHAKYAGKGIEGVQSIIARQIPKKCIAASKGFSKDKVIQYITLDTGGVYIIKYIGEKEMEIPLQVFDDSVHH